jgi:transcriptional regulator with XRE-family HTH domain
LLSFVAYIFDEMVFKENLKAELAYKGMLVKELAKKAGVHKRAIDNYLNTQSSLPTADAAVRIARALGVTVEYLITGETLCGEKILSSLAPDIRTIVHYAEQLDERDLRIVVNLVKALKERE